MIEPNELQITGADWTVRDLKTTADCDRAVAALAEIIAKIEGDLTSERATADPEWQRRATRTLSLRRAARMQVYVIRKDLRTAFNRTWEQSFVEKVKALDPELFHQVIESLRTPLPIAA
jgi:hypothetical protein